MFLPFLPGRFDSLAPALSMMAQLFSFASLLLVPVGLWWLGCEISTRGKAPDEKKYTNRLAFATLLLLALIALVVSVGAFAQNNLSFAVLFLIVCFFVLSREYLKRKRRGIVNPGFNPAPIYLVIIPVAVALVRLIFIPIAVEFSRYYAIKRSEPLITTIESYYEKNGSYPISLHALHGDILPGMVGIERYHYEPSGESYNLFFKQFSDDLAADEIIMYNKSDQHALSSHLLDILEYSGEQLALRRGDRRKDQLSTPHWVSIKFD